MTLSSFLFFAANRVSLDQFQSNLKPRHYAVLALGLPILIFSIVSSEPVLAGSEFIALMIMMLDRQLSQLVEWLNGQLKFWQVITVISIATILLTQWINPVNAISSTTLVSGPQFGQLGFAVASIKLAIVSLNLLVMAVILFALRLAAKLLVKDKQ
jgi:phosphoglycerol transferase MdoB-like AlkP superfamily enzyme